MFKDIIITSSYIAILKKATHCLPKGERQSHWQSCLASTPGSVLSKTKIRSLGQKVLYNAPRPCSNWSKYGRTWLTDCRWLKFKHSTSNTFREALLLQTVEATNAEVRRLVIFLENVLPLGWLNFGPMKFCQQKPDLNFLQFCYNNNST